MVLFLLSALLGVQVWGEGTIPDGEPQRAALSLEISGGGSGSVEMEAGGLPSGEMRTREYALELEYERKLKTARPRVLKVSLEVLRDEFRGSGAGLVMPEELAVTGLEASLLTVHNARWLSYFSLTAGWHSAGGDRLDSDGFGVQAVALGRYAVNERLHLLFGAHVDSLAEGSDRANPVLGLDWAFAPRWHLALGVPKTGLMYALTDTLAIGLKADLKSEVYAVARAYRMQHGLPADLKLEYFEVRAGLHVDWRFAPQASLTMTAGTILMRRLDFEVDDYLRRVKTDGTGGGYATVGCSIRF